MELKQVGIEALKYAAYGAVAFASGALMGKMCGGSPLLAGAVNAVTAVAVRALDPLTRKLAESQDWNLSTFKIARTLGQGLVAVASIAALVALGIIGAPGAIFFGVVAAVMFGLNLGIGIYLSQSEEDQSINNFVMDDNSPWHVKHSYA
jgi:hypothetical protein